MSLKVTLFDLEDIINQFKNAYFDGQVKGDIWRVEFGRRRHFNTPITKAPEGQLSPQVMIMVNFVKNDISDEWEVILPSDIEK
tara:strand:+ start:389 stop:637 length:249 start_codon:yes stop_codon:yes gene_type:complete